MMISNPRIGFFSKKPAKMLTKGMQHKLMPDRFWKGKRLKAYFYLFVEVEAKMAKRGL